MILVLAVAVKNTKIVAERISKEREIWTVKFVRVARCRLRVKTC